MINEQYLNNCAKTGDGDKDSFAWTMREAVARKVAGNIWGQGFLFQSENEKIEKAFSKFNKMNNFTSMCSFIERYCSKFGRCIVTLNKTKTGDIMLNIPNPFYFQGVGKVFVQPQLAVVYQRFTVDTIMYVVKSTYTCKYVRNELFKMEGSREVSVFDKRDKIFEALQVEEYWEHNLGFPPIVELTNLPFFQFQWNNMEFITITDWFPALYFEDLAYSTIYNLHKELIYCHSRILVDNANQAVIENIKTKLLTNSSKQVDISDWIFETDTGAEFKPIPGNGDFTKYTNTLDHIYDFYFKFAGSSRFSEGGGAQKTVAETSTVRSSMIENTQQKITLRTSQFTDLLRKVFAMLGLVKDYWSDEMDEFTFKINGNILKDDSTFIDNLIKQMEIGAITPIDFIQQVYNIPKKEATRIFEDNKKFNEENGISTMFSEDFGDNEGGEEKGIDAMGEHKQPDKKGTA